MSVGGGFIPRRIVTGGQTGADRAALDAALESGLEVGGWIPKGRWTEDGPLPARYPNFRETESTVPAVRTEWNVRDADATLVLSHGAPTGGSSLTLATARRLARPLLHFDLEALGATEAATMLARWLDDVRPDTLNVAGPRHSEDAAIYDATRRLLRAVLARGTPGKGSARR